MDWKPMETAPKDGRWFWGLCDGTDAILMVWHPAFNAFVSSWRRMSMAKGWTINGQSEEDHSPDVCDPTHWVEADLPCEVDLPKPLLPAALTEGDAMTNAPISEVAGDRDDLGAW